MKETFPIKKILLAADFGELTDKLIEFASSLANDFKADVILVYAIDNNLYYSESPYEHGDYFEDYEEKITQKLLDFEKKLRKHGVEVSSTTVNEGVPYRVIQSAAKELNPDLIMIGANRRGVIERILGTTAENVIRKVSQPVWIIHPNDSVKPIKNVLCPVDLTPESDHTLTTAIGVARKFKAHLHILHVVQYPRYYPDPDDLDYSIADWVPDTVRPQGYTHVEKGESETNQACRELSEHLKKIDTSGVEIDQLIREGRIDSQISQAVNETNCDLLVLGTCEKKGLLAHLSRGTAEALVRKLNCSIVTVRHCTKKNGSKLRFGPTISRPRNNRSANKPTPSQSK